MSPRAACRLEALGHRVYDYVNGIADWKAAGLATEGSGQQDQRVIDAMRPDVPTCRPEETIADISSRITDDRWDVCIVIDCDRKAIGRIRNGDLGADPHHRARDIMEPGPSTVRPDSRLEPLVRRMHHKNAPHVTVTNPQGELLGLLLRDDADRVLAGEPRERIWRDCDCCPGQWTS